MENRGFVDQKLEQKYAAVRDVVLARRDLFARQGSVVATTRTYRGRCLGPFYSVRFRADGKQASVYLGCSATLAERVEGLLNDLREETQQHRMLTRLKRHARAHLRQCKASWQQDLAALGLYLKGYEIRHIHGSSAVATSPALSDKVE